MFPGPLVEAMGWVSGTRTGDTKTESFSPSGESMAVPRSLMVERIILAYSKSTDVREEMPLHWIWFFATFAENMFRVYMQHSYDKFCGWLTAAFDLSVQLRDAGTAALGAPLQNPHRTPPPPIRSRASSSTNIRVSRSSSSSSIVTKSKTSSFRL